MIRGSAGTMGQQTDISQAARAVLLCPACDRRLNDAGGTARSVLCGYCHRLWPVTFFQEQTKRGLPFAAAGRKATKPGRATMLIVDRSIVIVGRKWRSKWWEVTCPSCPASQRRKDGSCKHERLVMDMLRPEIRKYASISACRKRSRQSYERRKAEMENEKPSETVGTL